MGGRGAHQCFGRDDEVAVKGSTKGDAEQSR
jgi:hypothetical protein